MHDTTKLAGRFLAVLVAGLLLVGLSACSSSDDGGASSDTTAASGSGDTTDTTAADGGGGGGDATAPVIADFTFTPDPIEVGQGDSVTWTNEDDFAHTVTADEDAFDSGNLDGGATFEQTFDETGEFTYHCAIHSQMTGTVNVT